MGTVFVKSKGKEGTAAWEHNKIEWKVRPDIPHEEAPPIVSDPKEVGLKGFNPLPRPMQTNRINFLTDLLLRLWPGDWRLGLDRLNAVLKFDNNDQEQIQYTEGRTLWRSSSEA